MNILYLCPDLGIPVLGPKGGAVHVREMVAALGCAGHKVVIATQLLNKSPWEVTAAAPAPLLQVRPGAEFVSAVQALKQFNELIGVNNSLPGELRRILYNKDFETELKRRFDAEPPDLLYERASLYSTAGANLARLLRRPLLLELNAPLAIEQSAYRATGFGTLAAQAERWVLNQADGVIVVSDELRQHVVSLGVPFERIHVIPNGVNAALFHPGPRDEHLRTRWQLGNGPVIGFVGGLRPWHGAEVLPSLLERLNKAYPGIRLLLVGDGPLRGELERLLTEKRLRAQAVFTGQVAHEDVPALIRQFDAAVAPYPEPDHAFYFSPLKLFEYMACGIPVVAPELGQIKEVITRRENGLTYAPGDFEGLAKCCNELLADAELRVRLGKAAAAGIHERFTWEQNARRVTELAESLTKSPIENRRPPQAG